MTPETEKLASDLNDTIGDFMKNSANPLLASTEVFVALSMVAATHAYCVMPEEHRVSAAELFGTKIKLYIENLNDNPMTDFMVKRAAKVK